MFQKKYQKIFLTTAALVSLGPSAQASANLIQCDFDSGRTLTGCSLQPFSIPATEDFEVSLDIRYKYQCRGHSAPISLKTNMGTYELRRGQDWQSLTNVVSRQGVALSYNQDDFYRKTFLTGCQLIVDENVNKSPSDNTLHLWSQEAISQAKIIDLTLDLYLQAISFEEYESWDVTKSNIMLSSIVEAKQYYDEICMEDSSNFDACDAADDFSVLEIVLRAKLRGRPSPFTPQTIDLASQSASSHYFNQLQDEKQEGQRIQDRFTTWNIAPNRKLEDSLSGLPI
ncbi:hypothetical protein [Pseudobacteriovorax antillogorgiicola]|uniref:Uncharacterized protein n=1 Tax=Pseudobacteriovorax antillogorgiicola TaxID=1513793 RepID=A0A1Y6BEZ3_9BACT|nr:hypothetical protein [Pseudobacteriovorax antillogorgiicola]TCS56262.1 hypothetical protein EDD56_10484 [Pseudobacteriovorax antillogorgiicola]SMF07855.1 hypothetical protein SAMN06296036_104249 [Pseudobacteriovorax antillogorgiicola]